MLQAVNEYLHNEFASVKGGCIPHIWQSLQPLHNLQAEASHDLPVAEIGVCEGKLFIGLVKAKGVASGNLAIDIFDTPQRCPYGGHVGSLKRFMANLEASGVAPEAVRVVPADSTALGERDVADIQAQCNAFSLFSVDGNPQAEYTISDVRLAMRLTSPHGVILVGHYYDANAPGVQEGIAKLYLNDSPRFVPLLYTCNTLFLCHVSAHAAYLRAVHDFVQTHHADTQVKIVKRFGRDTLNVVPNRKGDVYLHLESESSRLPSAANRSNRPAGGSGHAATIQPRMTAGELEVLAQHARGASVIEFGAGGSTVFFFENGARSVVSVESDPAWIEKISCHAAIVAAEADGRWLPKHVDIGTTRAWGYPADESKRDSWPSYHSAVWSACAVDASVVLVDGRFRVACALQAAIHAPKATVLWHDFNDRRQYRAALEWFDELARVDTLIVLRRKQNIDEAELLKALEQHQFDPE